MNKRIDVSFILHGGHQSLNNIPTVRMGELTLEEPDYGSGARAVPLTLPSDVKYIRITDFGDYGIPEGHEYVTASVVESRYTLEEGDILFARSGATAGKTFIYTSDIGPSIFAGYCIRFKFDTAKVLPLYVYYYTKTARYAAWVRSIQRPSGQPNINKEEFKAFTLPVPSLSVQQELVRELQAAQERRAEYLRAAEAELANIDKYVLEALGLL